MAIEHTNTMPEDKFPASDGQINSDKLSSDLVGSRNFSVTIHGFEVPTVQQNHWLENFILVEQDDEDNSIRQLVQPHQFL